MNTIVAWELKYVGECFLLGALLMLLYDCLRISRIVIPHTHWLIAIQDILYWLLSGVMMFLLLYKEDAGSIRWFAVAVTAAGMLLYNFGISRFAVPFIGRCIRWPLMQAVRFVRFVAKKLHAAGKMVTGLLKKPIKKVKIVKRVKKKQVS